MRSAAAAIALLPVLCAAAAAQQRTSVSSYLQEGYQIINTTVGGANGINASTVWTCPDAQSASETPGCTAAVTVTYYFNPIFPYIKIGTLAFSSTSKMVVSQ